MESMQEQWRREAEEATIIVNLNQYIAIQKRIKQLQQALAALVEAVQLEVELDRRAHSNILKAIAAAETTLKEVK